MTDRNRPSIQGARDAHPLANVISKDGTPKEPLTSQAFEEAGMRLEVVRVAPDEQGQTQTVPIPVPLERQSRATREYVTELGGAGRYDWKIRRTDGKIADQGSFPGVGPTIPADRIGTITTQAYARELQGMHRGGGGAGGDVDVIPLGDGLGSAVVAVDLDPAEKQDEINRQRDEARRSRADREKADADARALAASAQRDASVTGTLLPLMRETLAGNRSSGGDVIAVREAHLEATGALRSQIIRLEGQVATLQSQATLAEGRREDAVRAALTTAEGRHNAEVAQLRADLNAAREQARKDNEAVLEALRADLAAKRTELAARDTAYATLQGGMNTARDGARMEGYNAGVAVGGAQVAVMRQEIDMWKSAAESHKSAAGTNEKLYMEQRQAYATLTLTQGQTSAMREFNQTIREIGGPIVKAKFLGPAGAAELAELAPLLERLKPHAPSLVKHQRVVETLFLTLAPHLDRLAPRTEQLMSYLDGMRVNASQAEQAETVDLFAEAIPLALRFVLAKRQERREAHNHPPGEAQAGAGGAE